MSRMDSAMTNILREPEDASAEWFSAALGTTVISIGEPERIGTGQMSRNYRFTLSGDGPASVVIKIAAAEGEIGETASRAYQREVGFYREIASSIEGVAPRCLHHAISSAGDQFTLVLEDLAPAQQGNQIAGCSIAEAKLALRTLAALHASRWNDRSLFENPTLHANEPNLLDQVMPIAHAEFERRYAERLQPGTIPLLERFSRGAGAWSEFEHDPIALGHADFRLDNLMFTSTGVTAVDWQTVRIGPPAADVAYFLGNSLLIEDRRAHEDELFESYLASLAEHGVTYGIDALRIDYARGAWLGPLITVLGAFTATRTDRGDDMFIAMADRACAQIADHNSLNYL